jgi:D-3-phosphoglycerate dehydrogenase / 2-oxoglutarate reductase
LSSNKTILATTSNFAVESESSRRLLEKSGYTLIVNPYGRVIAENELLELLEKYKPVGLLAGTEKIPRSILEKTKEYLRAISRVGVGADNVDLAAAAEFNVPVTKTAGILSEPVAELTIGLILAGLRHICRHDRDIRSGIWKKRMGGLLSKRTLGIIGFGDIGQRVGELAKTFGTRVIYHDLYSKQLSWAEDVSMAQLLKEADIVSIHAGGSDVLIGRPEMEVFAKPGCMLINTARGALVDEATLYEFLTQGRIAYACLDVFDREPYNGPLAELNNVILSPHVGSSASESRIEMEIMAVNNLLNCLEN